MSEKIYDAYGNEVKIDKNSFKLCQQDKKIHDQKFETKATTFFKDAFKRFCKNKSSIVGAFIIGILVLLSIIVPLVSPHSDKDADAELIKLQPKLFTYQEGSDNIFWTGLELKTGIAWNFDEECPEGYEKVGVKKIVAEHDVILENATSSSSVGGGVLVILADKTTASMSKDFFVYNYKQFEVSKDDNVLCHVEMDDNDGAYKNYTLGQYRILLTYEEKGDTKQYELQSWTYDYDDIVDDETVNVEYDFNLSDVCEELGVDTLKKCRIRIELKTSDVLVYTCIADVKLTSDSEDEEYNQLLDDISIDDANKVANMTKGIDGKFPDGYWQSNGIRNAAKISMRTVDFYYDKYEVALGETTKTLGKSQLDNYIREGWCSYDYETQEFEILNEDKCPVTEILGQTHTTVAGETLTYVTVRIIQYKEKGYDTMPIFLFGTDDTGYDLVTKCFKSLLKSLGLALITSAICFCFGLVWGSISGYFGGNVDLFMERFCDILGGVPWMVVMTLTMLLLDNSELAEVVGESNVVLFKLGVALCLTGWMGTAGTTRTQFYRFKGREYILASRTLGASDGRLIFKHILPNAMGTIITSSVLMIPSVIFSESSLAYLNLIKGSNSFGTILSNNQQYLSTYPWLILFPSIIISLIMISFNLFGNGLRDAFNPSLKGTE